MIEFRWRLDIDGLLDGCFYKRSWDVEADDIPLPQDGLQEQCPQWCRRWSCCKGLNSWVVDGLAEAFGNKPGLQWWTLLWWSVVDDPLGLDDLLELFRWKVWWADCVKQVFVVKWCQLRWDGVFDSCLTILADVTITVLKADAVEDEVLDELGLMLVDVLF